MNTSFWIAFTIAAVFSVASGVPSNEIKQAVAVVGSIYFCGIAFLCMAIGQLKGDK